MLAMRPRSRRRRKQRADSRCTVLELDVRTDLDAEAAVARASAWGAEALLAIDQPAFPNPNIAQVALRSRIPAIGNSGRGPVANGYLMSYAPNKPAIFRTTAGYVDKLLRGAKPADLPIENPREFEFVVNLTTAETLGVTFPPDVAAQVTEWV